MPTSSFYLKSEKNNTFIRLSLAKKQSTLIEAVNRLKNKKEWNQF